MSLVPTYVKAVDGKYYKNPVYSGKGWYICFDDDDPIEVVKEKEVDINRIFSFMGWDAAQIQEINKQGETSRLFPPHWKHFREAVSYFIELRGSAKFPVPSQHDGVIEERKKLSECVVYGAL